jgi:sulfur carrier protein
LISIMKLTVNGDTLTLDGTTIADLVTQLNLTGRRLAVEVNRDIVPKSQHGDFTLKDGDVVEIVHAIGGG